MLKCKLLAVTLILVIFTSCTSVALEEIEDSAFTVEKNEIEASTFTVEKSEIQVEPDHLDDHVMAEDPDITPLTEYDGEIVVHRTEEGLYEVVGDPRGDVLRLRLLYSTTHNIYEVVGAGQGEITYEYIEYTDDELGVSMRYPQFSGIENVDIESGINELLQRISNRVYNAMLASDSELFRMTTRVNVKIEVKHVSRELISLYISDVSAYYGGVDSMFYALNINPNDGYFYELMDFYYVNESFVDAIGEHHEVFAGFQERSLSIARSLMIPSSFTLENDDADLIMGNPSAYYTEHSIGLIVYDPRFGIYGNFEVPYEDLDSFLNEPNETDH